MRGKSNIFLYWNLIIFPNENVRFHIIDEKLVRYLRLYKMNATYYGSVHFASI